jgi:hypothetical protein
LTEIIKHEGSCAADDPTSAKRLWSVVEGGGKFRVFEQQVRAKMVDITVEHYSSVLVTSSVERA